MVAVWIYQTALFSLVAHGILSPSSGFRPEFVLAAMFIATFVLLIDSYMVMRSGWHIHGINELKRGGLDISGGPWLQIKNGIFLTLRILLSLALAQLTAIFTALLLFQSDIDAEITNYNEQQNASVIASIKDRTEADIKLATDAVSAEEARVIALTNDVSAARQTTIDPASNDSRVRAAEEEIKALTAEKAKKDDELSAVQKFAADELAGLRAEPGNSGVAGSGPVRAAAQERVRTATANDAAAAKSLAQARARVDALRKQIGAAGGTRARQAQLQLPAMENDLSTETAQLTTLRERLATLTNARDETIRRAMENAPDRVSKDEGFLGQLAALKRVAQDPEIAAIIILIDAVSFGLELSAVLSKVTSFIPTTYAALLARNAFIQIVDIVDEMERRINGTSSESDDETEIELSEADQAEQDGAGTESAAPPESVDLNNHFAWPADAVRSGQAANPDPAAPRRRGRPRKTPLNLAVPDMKNGKQN